MPIEDARTITANEAWDYLGIPAGTIRTWAARGKLYAVGIGPDGQRWYYLHRVLELRDATRDRKVGGHERRGVLTEAAAAS